MTFAEKIRELVANRSALPDGAVEAEAQAFLELAQDWPLDTQVSLSRVAYLVSAMLLEPNLNVRRMRVSDALQVRSQLG